MDVDTNLETTWETLRNNNKIKRLECMLANAISKVQRNKNKIKRNPGVFHRFQNWPQIQGVWCTRTAAVLALFSVCREGGIV
jgi:hypothetical protein